MPEHERAEVLEALACVDAVVVFDEETPAAIIEALQPDVLVKGADWAADAIVGRDTVEARGGRVVRMPIESGWSTSAIIERAQIRIRPIGRDPAAYHAPSHVIAGASSAVQVRRRPRRPASHAGVDDRPVRVGRGVSRGGGSRRNVRCC